MADPGGATREARYAALQARLEPLFANVFPDRNAPRTVVVIPALSLDPEMLGKILGVQHYEERLLCMLMLLRLPRTRVVYVTSMPVDPVIVDYYLHLLPGVPGLHARKRLTLLSCGDEDPLRPLTSKLLERPRMIARIREAIGDPESAHMTCFHAREEERSLALELGIPLFANDPSLEHLGSKSGSRRMFRAAGVELSPGAEDLRDAREVAAALAELRGNDATLRRAAVKLEYGTSGEGNAVFSFEGAPTGPGLERWVTEELPRRLAFEAEGETWDSYEATLRQMGGIVEAWIEGEGKRSPSVQCRIDPGGEIQMISTHDQVLGGPNGQIFLGSTFPADEAYRQEIARAGLAVGAALRDAGALGRYGVDFVSVREADGWRNYAIEINLRKGGTTHTFRILQFLTDGAYDTDSGLFRTPQGKPRFYYASDNLRSDAYKRLTPEDLMEIAVDHDLHFHVARQRGVFFHLIGALSSYGKLGVVCVEHSPEAAVELYDRTVAILDAEAGQPS